MAHLEAEAMLLGIWKNIEELEASVCLDELQVILKAERDREFRNWRFFGHLKGIDIGEDETVDTEERFKEVQRRAQAKVAGVSEEAVDLANYGLDFAEE